jgi:endonuclease/exonuclease/phosphatase family metal-dependent hydrolase
MRVITWNLFHGRSLPPTHHGLLGEFAAALGGWEWDALFLQECPPWWPERLGRAFGVDQRLVLTSRNALLPLRRAVASRDPELLKSNGGGCDAILVRGTITDHRTLLLARWPERRRAHGVRLADGRWLVNLHATVRNPPRALQEARRAAKAGQDWAAGAPLVLGGDFNLRGVPELPGLRHVAGHYVDHVFTVGHEPAGRGEVLERGALSDHAPVAVDLLP